MPYQRGKEIERTMPPTHLSFSMVKTEVYQQFEHSYTSSDSGNKSTSTNFSNPPTPTAVVTEYPTQAYESSVLRSSTEVVDETPTPSTMNTTYYTLQPPEIDTFPTWKKGTFCERYIGHTFSQPLQMCGGTLTESDALRCWGSSESHQMAMCSARFLAVEPKKLKASVVDCDACNIDGSGSLHLIQNDRVQCPQPNIDTLKSNTEKNDPVFRSMKGITSNDAVSVEHCQVWINKTAYFFHSQRYHIYFRMYSYYNLYKTLLERGASPGEYIVVRMAEATGYRFEDFERALFPELRTLSEFPDQRVCFREVVFSPWTYACVMFRCKMDHSTRARCLECNGQDLQGTSLMTFRTRALQACSLRDQSSEERRARKKHSVVFVKRKPYNRWKGDTSHNFQRVLSNQDDLIKELKRHFPNVEVHDVFMEDIDLCQQMSLVHDCDVYMGVHGAGLVHAWWLQDDAALIELVPPNFSGNPSFKTLTMLAGRHYHSLRIIGSTFRVSVDIKSVIRKIESILSSD